MAKTAGGGAWRQIYLIFLQFLAEESLPESHSEVKQDKYNEIMSKIESDPVWPDG